MTPPPGPPAPPPYVGPPGPARRRRRPSAWWFAAPLLMMLLGGVLTVGGFVSTLGPLADEDAVVPADGTAQVVEVGDGEPRLLMRPANTPEPRCEVRDAASGETLELDGPGASYTYGDSRGSWTGFAVVDPVSDAIELTCTGEEGDDVRVIPSPGGLGSLFGGVVLALVGVGLGGLGFVVLVVLVVLYATGAPRSTTRDGDASTDRSASGSAG